MDKPSSEEVVDAVSNLGFKVNPVYLFDGGERTKLFLYQLESRLQEFAPQYLPRIVTNAGHFWIELTIDGRKFAFDPAFESGFVDSQHEDLATLHTQGEVSKETLVLERDTRNKPPLRTSVLQLARDGVLGSEELLARKMDKKTLSDVSKMMKIWKEEVIEIQKAMLATGEKSLAARIPGHDFNNLTTPLNLSDVNVGDNEKNIQEMGAVIRSCLMEFRALVASMGLLQLGPDHGSVYLRPMAGADVAMLLNRKAGVRVTSYVPEISTAVYFSIYQMIKNAFYYKAKAVSVAFEETDEHQAVHVNDNGFGIRDAQGNPMPSSELPQIFGAYSSRPDGGLGLEAVKNITEMQNGKVAVATRALGHESIQSWSEDPSLAAKPVQGIAGTNFVLRYEKKKS